jgi:hypothetical protein
MKFSSIRSILVYVCAILPLVTAHSELIVSMAESTLAEIAEAEVSLCVVCLSFRERMKKM